MKVQVIQEFNSARGIIPVGSVINIDESLLAKLAGKVKPITDGRDLPHYCQPADSWCSSKLAGSDYPAGCIRSACGHHHGQQGTTMTQQNLL